jgi:hypothetical protein
MKIVVSIIFLYKEFIEQQKSENGYADSDKENIYGLIF